MTLRLYDTRRAVVAPLEPDHDGPIGLYVCGITPYDTTHLGHAFTYLAFDVLRRHLEYGGRAVRYVQNVTDVDDDMLRHAREQEADYLTLGRHHTERFLADMGALNWRPPDVVPRATEHIPHMVAMIETLLARGLAYRASGHVYLSAAADPGFGSVSHLHVAERLAVANERGNRPDLPGKRDPIDPVLWQPSAADEPAWASPWGAGRPGWHIECSAMSVTHLGPRVDIHGGGRDLAFPHHEVERAQSEGATGVRPFVGHWVHTGMVHHEADKMSKSLGNLVLVGDLLADWPPDTIRLALTGHHYRADLGWTPDRLAAAAARLERWSEAVGDAPPLSDPRPGRAADLRAAALAALDDDLDTPAMMTALDALADTAHTDDPGDRSAGREAAGVLRDLGTRILGLRLEPS
jgi:L-cysteine:1D-myo-inositol 2-amino-2-deoxy-alpha-D-glucopyranoside ligase